MANGRLYRRMALQPVDFRESPLPYARVDGPLLVNVVSKNGNLLLNIPLPGHGRPDDDEFTFLDKFGAWMALNSEAIYSTRPWKIHGECPTKGGGSLYGGPGPQFVAGDIRFTARRDSLYAIALAWPEDRKLVIRS